MDQASRPPGEPTPAALNAPAADVDWTGRTLGDFRVLRRLGQGGMGQVYLAEQVSLRRKVALKLLRPELAANATALARFKQEAEAVARATHAHIVQIYAIGEAAGASFMALEYVEGKNLREYLEKKGTADLMVGLHVMGQVAAALQRASELGIIHRDVKPENILLTRTGEVKVADFGLSRIFDAATHLTRSDVTMGTPLYMSPEQIERGPVDHRSDLYSFGVTCYHMFAGHPPYRGKTPIEVAYQHVHGTPEPLAAVRPDLPADLVALVGRLMAKDPADRPQTAREVAREVGRLRDVLVAMGMTGSGALRPALAALASDSLPVSAPPAPPRRPRRQAALVVGSVVLALAGGFALGWYGFDDPPPTVVPDAVEPGKPAAPDPEKDLQRLVQLYQKPDRLPDVMAGLTHSADLGLLYLREHRLDDAAAFFTDLGRPERIVHYRRLGELGQAMVAAFRDDPAESNRQLLRAVDLFEKLEKKLGPNAAAVKLGGAWRKELLAQKAYGDEFLAYLMLWKDNPQVRAMVARALEHNFRNDPANFPRRLEPYRHPPKATVRPAPVSPS